MRMVRPLLVVEVVVVGVAVVEGGDPPDAPGVVLKATGVPRTGGGKNKKIIIIAQLRKTTIWDVVVFRFIIN